MDREKEEKELEKLKKEAKKLYRKAQDFGDLSCGRNLAEHIRPGLHEARQKFNQVWGTDSRA